MLAFDIISPWIQRQKEKIRFNLDMETILLLCYSKSHELKNFETNSRLTNSYSLVFLYSTILQTYVLYIKNMIKNKRKKVLIFPKRYICLKRELKWILLFLETNRYDLKRIHQVSTLLDSFNAEVLSFWRNQNK